jgi:hypothetical protein
MHYIANVYIISDPKNPANEGTVKLFKFGKKIFDKIMAAMQPEFEDEESINPFDFWQGANFKLKIRKVDGYWNYDKSEFESPSPLLNDDDALEALWKKENSLAEFLSASNFKSYEDLEKRLNQVLGGKQPQRKIDSEVQDEEYTPEVEEKSYTPSFKAPKPVDEDEDDALSYFQRLAE